MSDQTDSIIEKLSYFGLTSDESILYLCLLKNSNTTALILSRKTKLSRTKVYRLLGNLIEKGLATEKIDDVGHKFNANEIDQLQIILDAKTQELSKLKTTFPDLIEQLSLLKSQDGTNTKILFYKGIEGLKQITWNSTKAKGTFRIYEIDRMNKFLNNSFAEKVRQEFEKNKIEQRQLTTLTKYEPYLKHTITKLSFWDKYWELRYVSPQDISFQFEVIIYNDVYALYTFEEDEIFCVEIHNPKLAQMQKQIFDFIWKHSDIMIKSDNFGGRKLE